MPNINALSDNFAALGFGDTYFINNFGSLLLSLFYIITLQLFTLIHRQLKFARKYLKEKSYKLETLAFWNSPIRIIMEGYSMLSLSTLMSMRNIQWDYFGQKIDTLFAFMSLAIVILFPLLILIF